VKARELVSLHPLVRVHPESGRKSLYVSPGFLKRIDGLAPRESEQLLALLFEHVIRPEFTVRFKWTEGAIAFWDNRSTAHLAPKDLADLPYDRQLYRTTLVGDVPIGVNGLTSVALAGEPVLAYGTDDAA
jgi:taurine dioxygenase